MELNKKSMILVIILLLGSVFFIIKRYLFVSPPHIEEKTTTTSSVLGQEFTNKEIKYAVKKIKEIYPDFNENEYRMSSRISKNNRNILFTYYIDNIETNYVIEAEFKGEKYSRVILSPVSEESKEFLDEEHLKQLVRDFINNKEEKLFYLLGGDIIDSDRILDIDGTVNKNNFKFHVESYIEKYYYNYSSERLTYRLNLFKSKEIESIVPYELEIN